MEIFGLQFSKHSLFLQAKLPASEISATINEFRCRHLAELSEVCILNHQSSPWNSRACQLGSWNWRVSEWFSN